MGIVWFMFSKHNVAIADRLVGLVSIRFEKGCYHVWQLDAAANVFMAKPVFRSEAMEFDGTPSFSTHVQGTAVKLINENQN